MGEQDDRIADLENCLIALQQRVSNLERQQIIARKNLRAIALGFLFFCAIAALGAKFDGDRWQWQLDGDQVIRLIEVLGVSGAIGGASAVVLRSHWRGQ